MRNKSLGERPRTGFHTACNGVSAELDIGAGANGAALRHNVPHATFALPALGGNTEFELDFVETHASLCMAGNFAVRNSTADTYDHGWACWLKT
jgi:hypothetical protein